MVDIDLIFKIASLAIIITIIHTFLNKAGRDEYAYMTLLAGVAIALVWVVPVILNLFNTVKSVFKYFN